MGVKIKIVEPGVIRTDFTGRSFDFTNDESMKKYQNTVQAFMATVESTMGRVSEPEIVAGVIWIAVSDGTNTLRYAAGEDAREIIANRTALDDQTFTAGMKAQMGLHDKPNTRWLIYWVPPLSC